MPRRWSPQSRTWTLIVFIGLAARLRADLSEHIYVWQRSWTPVVAEALSEHGEVFSQVDVLTAEASLPGVTAFPDIDWACLAALRRPIGVVVRLQRASAGMAPEVTHICREALRRARAANLSPQELQIDFDCPSNRLPEYTQLIKTLRKEVDSPRLTITALPDWLSRPAFVALADAADLFVLQVHAVDRPEPSGPMNLCDPQKALQWMTKASVMGRPFRLALPDYGYDVGFDRRGTYIGLRAEGRLYDWPEGTLVRRVMADPAGLAPLVRDVLTNPPANLRGLAWFRLPVRGDEMCWSWATFSRVRHGQTAPATFDVRQLLAADGARDLVVTNSGDGAAAPPPLCLHLRARQILAWDLAPGWDASAYRGGFLFLEETGLGPGSVLQPGESRRVGWLRLASFPHESP